LVSLTGGCIAHIATGNPGLDAAQYTARGMIEAKKDQPRQSQKKFEESLAKSRETAARER
jgi:hypothetical protein